MLLTSSAFLPNSSSIPFHIKLVKSIYPPDLPSDNIAVILSRHFGKTPDMLFSEKSSIWRAGRLQKLVGMLPYSSFDRSRKTVREGRLCPDHSGIFPEIQFSPMSRSTSSLWFWKDGSSPEKLLLRKCSNAI